jgi:hypothetical protein
MKKNLGTIILCGMAISFLNAAILFSGDAVKDIERSFSVKEGGTLTLESDRGTIDISTISGEKVEIQIVRKVRGWGRKKAEKLLEEFEVEFNQSGNDVEVEAGFDGGWDDDWSDLKIEFIINVPSKYNLNLKTSGGSITVDDIEGEVTAKTSGGSLHFGYVGGPVYGKTSGGSIHLEGGSGEADLKTSGGSISVGEVKGKVYAKTSGGSINIGKTDGEVDANTSGGSVTVEGANGAVNASTSGGSIIAYIDEQPKNDCELKTSGGSVKLYMAEKFAVDINAKTSGGKVKSDFNIDDAEISKTSIQGKINGGGPLLYLRTSGGNIMVSKK